MFNSVNSATCIGLSSILIWASLVAVVKLITESLTPISAIALIYSFSAVTILVLNGLPRFQHMSKAYVWGCGALFVAAVNHRIFNIGQAAELPLANCFRIYCFGLGIIAGGESGYFESASISAHTATKSNSLFFCIFRGVALAVL